MRITFDRQRVDLLKIREMISSDAELARRAELHYNTVSDALSGRGWHSRTLDKICLALNCNPTDILDTEGFPHPLDNEGIIMLHGGFNIVNNPEFPQAADL